MKIIDNINNNNPRVSIIIPSYNHGNYLKRALKSIEEQTYQSWEVIVIDNHSIDNTDEIVSNFSSKKIKYIKIHNNGIIAKSRNAGIKLAKGEWVAFLDSDDWWMPKKLEIASNYFDKKIDFIYHNLRIIDENDSLSFQKNINSRKLKTPVLLDLIINGNAIGNSSVVVRKKLLNAIGGISENRQMIAAEDFNTWMRIADITENFVYVNKCLGYYFIHSEGISKKDMSIPTMYATKEFLPILQNNQKTQLKAGLSYMKGRFSFIQKNYLESKKYFLYALRNGKSLVKVKSLVMILLIFLSKIIQKTKL